MKSQIHTYYNDTYKGPHDGTARPSIAEVYLGKALHHFTQIGVATEDGPYQQLKDFWNVKFYDGGQLAEYANKYIASQQVTLLDFSKVLMVTEYQQKDVGIRFYTSLYDDEVVIDIIQYKSSSKTEPGDRAELFKRFSGKFDLMICPKNMVNVFNEAQQLSYEVIDIKTFYCN